MGRKKGTFNQYYSNNERVIHYSKGVAPVIPPWNLYIDLLLLISDIQDEKDYRKKQSEDKKKCPSYSKKYWYKSRRKNGGV